MATEQGAAGAMGTEDDVVLAQFQVLTARLDEQAAEIAEQKAQIARLKAASATTRSQPPMAVPSGASRRAVLRGLLAAGGAIGALAVSRAQTAEAGTRTTLFPDNTTVGYGAAVSDPIGDDPANNIPPLQGTLHVFIASSGNFAKSPDSNSSVLGTASGIVGVQGLSETGIGGKFQSESGSGIQGFSTTGDGILGFSSGNLKYSLAGSGSGQAHGLIGNSANQFGISGINQNGNNWAGAFFNALANAPNSGRKGLFVQGDFVVVNGTKSAAIKTDKHGHRKLYAVEATENVFEDIGTTKLQQGKARVDLEEVFADTVNTGQKYQVFLTPKSADSKGLAVAQQDPKGFTVQELGSGTGSYEFDYRIVAKVKGQEGKRLEQFEPPAMPTPPTPLETPKTPQGEPGRADKA